MMIVRVLCSSAPRVSGGLGEEEAGRVWTAALTRIAKSSRERR